ncbi:MAG: hypothetical protein R3293_27165 [Candidatus Promineifilaceae bacterium]|nr:hypothetical protein [Candidatus Promineifilaceae bacterium]
MPESNPSRWRSWHYILLWIIAISSLIFKILLLAGLYSFRLRAQREVAEVNNILESVEVAESFDLPVVVDETLPISLTVPFSDNFAVNIDESVPVQMVIPINEQIAFPINEVVSINRDVTVSVNVAGIPIPVDIPIRADIPISLDVEVPVVLDVPVNTDIPINLQIDVPVDTEVPINAEVPVQLEFPVNVPLDEFGFNQLLQEVKDSLLLLGEVLGAPPR